MPLINTWVLQRRLWAGDFLHILFEAPARGRIQMPRPYLPKLGVFIIMFVYLSIALMPRTLREFPPKGMATAEEPPVLPVQALPPSLTKTSPSSPPHVIHYVLYILYIHAIYKSFN